MDYVERAQAQFPGNASVARFGAVIAMMTACLCASGPSVAQSSAPTATPAESSDTSGVGKIGRVHDQLRRAAARELLDDETVRLYGDYLDFKNRTTKSTGLSWSMDLSTLQQWGRPDGSSTTNQLQATPSFNWTLFNDKNYGEGSVQLSYIAVRYGTSSDAADTQNALGLITPINDFSTAQNIFAQLTYTHAFPGNKLLVTLGQYPIYNFDSNQYLANSQQNFNNYLLAQNGSATYPTAGWGAYAQFNATSTIQFAAGLQSAANPSGATLSTANFGDDGYAWFGYAQWTPRFHGLGSAQYSITYYQVPGVPPQTRATGWSFNAVQNIDDTWAVFARANGASGDVTAIRSSVALGAAMNNPLGRSPTDQIGVAFGTSDAASPPTLPADARNEKLIEAYWNWTFARGLLLTPDVQYIRDPALDPTRSSVWVLSLRATLMF